VDWIAPSSVMSSFESLTAIGVPVVPLNLGISFAFVTVFGVIVA
jgi:hypothetical protein